jgi:short-subunit dehydrogenase
MDKKVAFISGATSGLGASFARHFAQQGYDLILTGHPDDKISLDVEELKTKNDVNIDIILADLSSENDVTRLEEIIKKTREIDVLINNAGFFFGKAFWKNDIRSLENMVKVHISTPVRLILAALPNMTRNNKGTIINLSSLVSFMPVPQDAMYSATKLFNNSFMESLHISFKDKGIKVQVLCPGFVRNTNFHERAGMKLSLLKNWQILPWMEPENVVKISIRNLRKKNKVVVIPGYRNRAIKFFISILPRPLYYRFATRFLQ